MRTRKHQTGVPVKRSAAEPSLDPRSSPCRRGSSVAAVKVKRHLTGIPLARRQLACSIRGHAYWI